MARFIYGIHDPGGEHLMQDAPGWVVHTIDVRAETSLDFSARADQGFSAIGRLNWSYGEGTIPRPEQWGEFARLCAEYVHNSRGCDWWVVANEPNHPQEQIPGGPPLTAERYVDCYRMVYEAIKRAVPSAQIMPAAIAPWSVFNGMGWVGYFDEMMHRLEGAYDGINLHTYSRGYMPSAITSEDRMDPPWQQYRNGFRTYRDFLAVAPASQRHKPVHITETNGNGVWPSDRSGWVQAAYAEIDAWNRMDGTQKVHALVLFRWPRFDQRWQFETKPGVHADFRDALSRGYRVPAPTVPATSTLHLPALAGGGPVSPPSPQRDWDERLTARGVRIETPPLSPGQAYYRVASGRWLDVAESGGRHHILADVLSEGGLRMTGVPLMVRWPGGGATIVTQAKPGEAWAADFPLSPSRNEFNVIVADGEFPSERVTGIGMGADLGGGFNAAEHTSTALVWQLAVHGESQPAPEPTPEPPTPPPPSVDPGHIDPRVLQAILIVESGGRAFGNDGRMIIRLENHVLAQRVPAPWYEQHFRHGAPPWTGHQWRPSANAAWRPMHTGKQADEWDPFLFASQFYPEQAAQSISMGSAQIVGFNHAKVGYPSARAMFEALGDRTHGETTQMVAFFAFLLNTTGMLTAIRLKDWREIARLYNGPGAVETYASLLERTYLHLVGG